MQVHYISSHSPKITVALLLVLFHCKTCFSATEQAYGDYAYFDKNYKCSEASGKGGMGEVFVCEFDYSRGDFPEHGKPGKIIKKVPLKWGPTAPDSLVEEEYKMGRMMLHPHVAHTYAYNPTTGAMYQEYAGGSNLLDLLKKRKGEPIGMLGTFLSFDEIDDIFFKQLLPAVRYIHHRGVLHLDLKLQNVVLNSQNKVKIVDFGLGEMVSESEENTSSTSSTGENTNQGCVEIEVREGPSSPRAGQVYAKGTPGLSPLRIYKGKYSKYTDYEMLGGMLFAAITKLPYYAFYLNNKLKRLMDLLQFDPSFMWFTQTNNGLKQLAEIYKRPQIIDKLRISDEVKIKLKEKISHVRKLKVQPSTMLEVALQEAGANRDHKKKLVNRYGPLLDHLIDGRPAKDKVEEAFPEGVGSYGKTVRQIVGHFSGDAHYEATLDRMVEELLKPPVVLPAIGTGRGRPQARIVPLMRGTRR